MKVLALTPPDIVSLVVSNRVLQSVSRTFAENQVLPIDWSFASDIGSLAVASAGAVVALVTFLINISLSRQVHASRLKATKAHFLTLIARLEISARQAASLALNVETRELSLGETLTLLKELHWWTSSDIDEFRRVLALRNRIVHTTAEPVNHKEVEQAASKVKELTSILGERLAEARGSPTADPERGILVYQRAVLDAISRLGYATRVMENDTAYDALVSVNEGFVAVAIKYRQDRQLTRLDLGNLADEETLREWQGILVVTNAQLSGELQILNSGRVAIQKTIEILQWNTSADDDLLHRAVLRVATAARGDQITASGE